MKRLYAPLKNWAKKPLFRAILFGLLVPLILFCFRKPLLRGMYAYLDVSENPAFQHAVYAVVLSGNAPERAATAAALYRQGQIDTLICTGANVSADLAIIGRNETEGELSRQVLLQKGVDSSRILLQNRGSSTLEEMQLIAAFLAKRPGSLVIITSSAHTRRVWRLRKKMLPRDRDIYCFGVPSGRYDARNWWNSEEGLIAVNTEWQKLLYYYWKY